jgi:hypothetical protein
VQEFGKEQALRQLATLDVNELLWRLSQHPDKNIRRFALELVEKHLKQGMVPLAKLELFFRAALFDMWPDRSMKRRALNLLAGRALADERQAELSASILNDFVRTAVKSDFELAAQALVAIKLQFPQVATAVAVPGAPG